MLKLLFIEHYLSDDEGRKSMRFCKGGVERRHFTAAEDLVLISVIDLVWFIFGSLEGLNLIEISDILLLM